MKCAIIGKGDYTDWDFELENLPTVNDDIDRFRLGMLDYGFSEDEINVVEPTFDDVKKVLDEWNIDAKHQNKIKDTLTCLSVIYFCGNGGIIDDGKLYLLLEKDSAICIDEIVRPISQYLNSYVVIIYDAKMNYLTDE